MSKGDIFPSERVRYLDSRTGAEITQLTNAPAIHQTLYFTNASIAADSSRLVFVSQRVGGWNLFSINLNNGGIVQLTDSDDVNPASPVLSRDGSRVFYTAATQIRSVRLDTLREQVLAEFDGARLGGLSLNVAGSRLLTVVYRGDAAFLATTETSGFGFAIFFEPRREVFYAQFCPADDTCVLYASGIQQRMWTVDVTGLRDRPLYLHDAAQWITHESWLGNTQTALFTKWRFGLMAIERHGDGLRTLARGPVWHGSSRSDGSLIVCDTALPDMGLWLIEPESRRIATLCFAEASSRGARWAETTPEDGLVTTETYGPQWTHPHPSFSPDGSLVAYTSDKSGYSQVYTARVPDVIQWEREES